MALVIFTSDSVFGETDPDIVKLVNGTKFVLSPNTDVATSEIRDYLDRSRPIFIVLAVQYRESESRYSEIMKTLTTIAFKKDISVYVVVNMGYGKVETPNYFGAGPIYYYPRNTHERFSKMTEVYNNLSKLGYPDLAMTVRKTLTASFADLPTTNTYDYLVKKMIEIREKNPDLNSSSSFSGTGMLNSRDSNIRNSRDGLGGSGSKLRMSSSQEKKFSSFASPL